MKDVYVSGAKICPFDGLWCDHIDSCDHLLSSQFGFDVAVDGVCPRFKKAKR
jgi:hypothetical protein